MLVLHHLGVSQSERVVWLLEELELPYEIVHHTRDPLTSPESLKKVPGNVTGRSPFLVDTDANITMSESGAICQYIVHRYGGGRLAVNPSDKSYPEYLQWLHYANATLQAASTTSMFLAGSGADPEAMFVKFAAARQDLAFSTLDGRLKGNKWLAGGDFTLADIMNLYCTSTQRYWGPISFEKYPNIVRWMKDCGERPAYQRAMEKGDPEMKLLLTADAPKKSMGEAGGVKSDHWKKTSSNL